MQTHCKCLKNVVKQSVEDVYIINKVGAQER